MKPKEAQARIKELNAEEKKLFDGYNWRLPAKTKILHLNQLIKVISELDSLKTTAQATGKK